MRTLYDVHHNVKGEIAPMNLEDPVRSSLCVNFFKQARSPTMTVVIIVDWSVL